MNLFGCFYSKNRVQPKTINPSFTLSLKENDGLLEVSENFNSFKKEFLFDRFCKMVRCIVVDEDFCKGLFTKMDFMKDYGDFVIKGSKFIGSFKNFDRNYVMECEYGSDKVRYTFTTPTEELVGDYTKVGLGGTTVIRYSDSQFQVYPNLKDGFNDKDFDTFVVHVNKTIQQFNSSGLEIHRSDIEKEENYFKNKTTHEKFFCSSDSNYIKARDVWRAGEEYLLVYDSVRYFPFVAESLEEHDFYLIGKNYHPDNKKMNVSGYYKWISPDLYEEYIYGECDIQHVWINQGRVYKKEKE